MDLVYCEAKWHRFLVPVPERAGESEEDFLKSAQGCLEAFFERNTGIDQSEWANENPLKRPHFGVEGPEKLKGEMAAMNFRDFRLRGMPDCNVEFYVGTPEDNYGPIGIDILTNPNDPEKRREIDFLRNLWRKFDYSFA